MTPLILLLALSCNADNEPVLEESAVPVIDADGDGVEEAEDCDDGDPAVFPGADEVCDGVDQDCDDLVDEAAVDMGQWHVDADGDGFGSAELLSACTQPSGTSTLGGDCDDSVASIHPDGVELCDGLDQDCDVSVDEGTLSTFWIDADGDGYGDLAAPVDACSLPEGASENSLDCDDTRGSVSPDGEEACDGLDNDCDSLTDESLGHELLLTPDGFETRVLIQDSAWAVASMVEDDSTGQIYVVDGNAGVHEVDPASGKATLFWSSRIFTGDVVMGDGSFVAANEIVVSDHNRTNSSSCCEGMVARINTSDGSASVMWTGSPSTSGADPRGLAFPTDTTTWTDGLYVADAAGATASIPQVWRGNSSGRSSVFRSSSLWNTNDLPRYLVFGPGGTWGSDLFVYNGYTAEIETLTPDGTLSVFAAPSEGRGMVFSSHSAFADSGGGDQLYMVGSSIAALAVDGSESTFATGFVDSAKDLDFNADGTVLYVAVSDGVWAVEVCDP